MSSDDLSSPTGTATSSQPPDVDAAADEVYISRDQQRLARFALRYTVPSALATALVISTIDYLISIRTRGSSISWYGVNNVSFIELYVPSAFSMPLIQGPLVLRRTLAARVAGKLDPALESLQGVGWLRWGLGLGVLVGSVWATIVIGIASVLSGWFPGVEFGGWVGLGFRALFTTTIALSVGILCAILAVQLRPDEQEEADAADGGVSVVGTRGGARRHRGRPEFPTERSGRLSWDGWRGSVSPDVLAQAEEAVYFTGTQRLEYLRRFFILLALSVSLVVLGLQTNSAVVVVAAVLIAPLMTPVMGLTLALVRGRPQRQIETLSLVAAATGFIFVLAWLTSSVNPRQAVVTTVLLDFTDPRLTDMLIALLAGAVGIYILVHTEASTALPGVAIGISLEPPIAAAGMMMAHGRADLVSGAFLMYLINLAAILVAGSLVLILSGFLPASGDLGLPRRVKVGLTISILLVVVLVIPLYRVSEYIWNDARDLSTVNDVVVAWARGTDLELVEADIRDDTIILDLIGTDDPPPTAQLADDLAGELERDVIVDVRIHPYERYLEASGK